MALGWSIWLLGATRVRTEIASLSKQRFWGWSIWLLGATRVRTEIASLSKQRF